MPEAFKPRSEYLLSEEGFRRYIVNTLGVSPDIIIVEHFECVTTVAAALAERRGGISLQTNLEGLRQRHAYLLSEDMLPKHLQSEAAFLQRYNQLVGFSEEDFVKSDIVRAIDQNRHKVPEAKQKRFEYDTAHLVSLVIKNLLQHHPDPSEVVKLMRCTFVLEKSKKGNILRTGDDLRVPLPQNHAGVIQGAPVLNDIIARCGETGNGNWANIAMLSSTYFNEELTRTIGQELFDLPQARIFASAHGLAQGVVELKEAMHTNARLQNGFGAMILSAVHHLDVREIKAAIHAAPQLLAPGGILAISDLQRFPDGQGSVWQLIEEARQAFNSQPNLFGVMTTSENEEGRQAVFMKP